MVSRARERGRRSELWRLGQALTGAVALSCALLLSPICNASAVYADTIDASGRVVGADVEGTIWLTFDPAGGPVTGRIEMTVQFDCRGKTREEHHVLELSKGNLDGDRLTATAVYVERSGLPKDELSRCKSAYETYQTREDSRRLIGAVDAAGMRASGTLGEYHPTVSWQIAWEPPDPAADPPAEPTDDATVEGNVSP
jgi:hypothetical protein